MTKTRSRSKKLKGAKDPLHLIRCGVYRVVFTIQDDVLLVLVIEVGHRKDADRDIKGYNICNRIYLTCMN